MTQPGISDRMTNENKNYGVDDRGTTQDEAVTILRRLRDKAFDSSNERIAMALGRTENQVEAWFRGTETIDDDVIMKARGIALQRNVDI